MLSRSWEMKGRGKDKRADAYDLARNSLSFLNHPYERHADAVEIARDHSIRTDSRYHGIVEICARPDMIKKCCSSDLKLQRLTAIETLCQATRSQIR